MNKKLKIALPVNVYDTTVGQSIAYMNFFGEFGEVILVTTENNLARVIAECDVLAMPGGMDVVSTRYNARPSFESRYVNQHYEYMDDHLFKPWLNTKKPIIAICRGMQILNVLMGGTLLTHINGHVQDDKYSRSYTDDEMYTNISGNKIVPINSFHHQAVDIVADGFQVIGWSLLYAGCPGIRKSKSKYSNYKHFIPKSGDKVLRTKDEYPAIPELMMHQTLRYIAFQYHPEELMDDFSLSLVHSMLNTDTTTSTYSNGPITEKATA